MAFFTLKNNQEKRYYFSLHQKDGEVILSSDTYESKDDAENGIEDIRTIASFSSRYHQKRSEDDQHFFVLKAANDQVIATSKLYSSIEITEAVIDTVMHLVPLASIVDACEY